MIFKSIKFHNYRCFLDGEISFTNSSSYNKNITLIIAPNGSGKTELLFSFWWVLYANDFDFASLSNKEVTPYALNTDVYRKIQEGEVNNQDYCEVTLKFEYENRTFILSRKETYKKTAKRESLKQIMEVELSEINDKGTRQLPNSNPEQINTRLEKMLPKKVLHGIIFDGERMQRISSSNEKAIEGIRGVVSDVTSNDLIELSIMELGSVKRKYNSTRRDLLKSKDSNASTLQQESIELEESIENQTKTYNNLVEEEENVSKRILEISNELLTYEKTREIQLEFNAKEKEKESAEKSYDKKIDELTAELNTNGPLLLTKILFNQVEEITSSIDIPQGLNVEAIESIIKKQTCVCGEKLDQIKLELLNELKSKLPPDNVNSLILEIIRQKNNNINQATERLSNNWEEIDTIDKEIHTLKERISVLKKELTSVDFNGEKLIKERDTLSEKRTNLLTRINSLRDSIESDKNLLIEYERKIINMSEKDKELEGVNLKIDFLNKSIQALERIKEVHNESALKKLNTIIKDSYRLLAEDFNYGRDIYIVQFTKEKYKIVTYLSKDVEEYMSSQRDWEFLSEKYGIDNNLTLTDEIKYEISILENATPHSTGQSKAVTISFVKAILDYSMMEKEQQEEFEVQKKYPVVIDAPFGDLSGKNLTLPASNLNSFSEQVILMLSPDSFKNVREFLKDDVGISYKIEKLVDKNYSTISKASLGVSI